MPLSPLPRLEVPEPEPVPLPDVAPVPAMFLLAATEELPLVPAPLLLSIPALTFLIGCEALALFFAGVASTDLPSPAKSFGGDAVPSDGPTTKLPLSWASGI